MMNRQCASFWINLCCMGVLFLGLCFLSGLSESVMAVSWLFFCPLELACSHRMPAAVGGWEIGKNWRKKFDGKFVFC